MEGVESLTRRSTGGTCMRRSGVSAVPSTTPCEQTHVVTSLVELGVVEGVCIDAENLADVDV